LQREGYRVLRFWNDDVLLRTDDVVAEIFRVLEEKQKA
jgi:very-short-patch-repair endonuclease